MHDDEMISLYLDDLDVEELERRLELASTTGGVAICPSNDGTDPPGCNGLNVCTKDISWSCN
jgi:hypothetical protein